MSNKNYKENEVNLTLSKKNDIIIQGKHIYHLPKGRGDVGIKSRGKIDFLTKYCGYQYSFNNPPKR